MIDKVEALRVATEYWDRIRFDIHFDKAEAAGELAAFGLFTRQEIGLILDTSVVLVDRAVEKRFPASVNVPKATDSPRRVWNIRSLSSLYLLALDYRAGGHVNHTLLRKVIGDNNSVRGVSELTDIPMDKIRRVMLD